MGQKPKIIVILGQTATGKSDFAVEVARQFGGEVVSADSRQVYKGMDLGTGKVTKKEMRGIPHYMLDIVSPRNKTFSASDFQKLASKKIDEIIKKGKVPIICGGAGFYLDTIVNGNIFPEVPPNEKLRKELYSKSAIALFEYLKKIDLRRAKDIDPKNKVRLIRAIEIAKALGKVPKINKSDSPFDLIKIGLIFPNEELKQRIYIRLIKRMELGMLKEMENLHKSGVSWKKMESFGLEYRYSAFYLQGKINKEEMVEKLFSQIWHFAKRQKTWFKRDKNIIWINPSKKADRAKALRVVDKFLK